MRRSDQDDDAGPLLRRWLRRADEFLGVGRESGKKGGARADHHRAFEEPAGSRPIGWIMVEDGVLTAEQVAHILQRRRELNAQGADWTFGEVAVEMGLASVEQVQRAIARQVREDYRT